MDPKTTILVLGFYDRRNIGDEAYKIAFSLLFNDSDIVCYKCIDDVYNTEIPSSVHTVILGGGDIINEYFMSKVCNYLKHFTGRVYGVSIGIPYKSCSHYLHIFDHVFVRSMNDYDICCKEIGEDNVSFHPDLAVFLQTSSSIIKKSKTTIDIGICLAQPLFVNNVMASELLSSICETLTNIKDRYDNVIFHLIPFNQNTSNECECDEVVNKEVYDRLVNEHMIGSNNVIMYDNLVTPLSILNFFNNQIDIVICMRYHSVIFSLLTNTPFIPLYCSQKISNVLNDVNMINSINCSLETDNEYKPIYIDKVKLENAIETCIDRHVNMIKDECVKQWLSRIDLKVIDDIKTMIHRKKKRKHVLMKRHLSTFEDVLSLCQQHLCKYTNITPTKYNDMLTNAQPLVCKNKSSLEIARFICFIISGQINHPCVWGLSSNLTRKDFVLYDAIKYVWEECKSMISRHKEITEYYLQVANCERRVLVDIDSILPNDFSKYHRSGWSYVINGLMNLDATSVMRQSSAYIDTYVDRTFHWGSDVLSTIGVIPYVKGWYGFVHHVFDDTHSDYNCINLFDNELFLNSLKCCKGLIALSKHLASQLRLALNEREIDVPVYMLHHPMEFVDEKSMFSMEKYNSRAKKRVVQIGAWLRKPYSLYTLRLCDDFEKVALKGKEMDQYFPPPGLDDAIADTLLSTEWFDTINKHKRHIGAVCRPCKHQTVNKYCEGLYDEIVHNKNSVIVLNQLSNDEYDSLLSESVVFLNLVDCSAVNTVIECIVRHTPVIVNRLPALEEILGKNYPGFYNSLVNAEEIIRNNDTISYIHMYISLLDKTRYKLEEFLNGFQDIVSGKYDGDNNIDYQLIKSSPYVSFGNGWLRRFIPSRYI